MELPPKELGASEDVVVVEEEVSSLFLNVFSPSTPSANTNTLSKKFVLNRKCSKPALKAGVRSEKEISRGSVQQAEEAREMRREWWRADG